jgi:transposase-like protein
MARRYSPDLYERVVAPVEMKGMSCRAAAAQFGVGISTAINRVRRLRDTGSCAPGKCAGTSPRRLLVSLAVTAGQGKRHHLARACRRTCRAQPQGQLQSQFRCPGALAVGGWRRKRSRPTWCVWGGAASGQLGQKICDYYQYDTPSAYSAYIRKGQCEHSHWTSTPALDDSRLCDSTSSTRHFNSSGRGSGACATY